MEKTAKIVKRVVLGKEVRYLFEKSGEEYSITVWYENESETVRFPDDEAGAAELFGHVVKGKALPGSVRDVLEDYCAVKSIFAFAFFT